MDLTLVSRAPLRLAVRFAPHDACFTEHFPGHPVVPGSLVVGLCMQAMRDHLGCAGGLLIERFSFSRFAPPDLYTLDIDDGGDAFLCTLRSGDSVFAQGRIKA